MENSMMMKFMRDKQYSAEMCGIIRKLVSCKKLNEYEVKRIDEFKNNDKWFFDYLCSNVVTDLLVEYKKKEESL